MSNILKLKLSILIIQEMSENLKSLIIFKFKTRFINSLMNQNEFKILFKDGGSNNADCCSLMYFLHKTLGSTLN